MRTVIYGICMGIADLIPGVSGSTIAVMLGFYDKFLENMNLFFSRRWKESLRFLVPLGTGVAITLLVLSKVIHFFIDRYP
ncbi:MAG: undecaprenyl phosphate translocase family protein, partial [Bacilli bacterium]